MTGCESEVTLIAEERLVWRITLVEPNAGAQDSDK